MTKPRSVSQRNWIYYRFFKGIYVLLRELGFKKAKKRIIPVMDHFLLSDYQKEYLASHKH